MRARGYLPWPDKNDASNPTKSEKEEINQDQQKNVFKRPWEVQKGEYRTKFWPFVGSIVCLTQWHTGNYEYMRWSPSNQMTSVNEITKCKCESVTWNQLYKNGCCCQHGCLDSSVSVALKHNERTQDVAVSERQGLPSRFRKPRTALSNVESALWFLHVQLKVLTSVRCKLKECNDLQISWTNMLSKLELTKFKI